MRICFTLEKMSRTSRIANIFLLLVTFELSVGDQQPQSNANCQLTNSCFHDDPEIGRTSDDLSNERSTTTKVVDKETNSAVQTHFPFPYKEPLLTTIAQASFHTAATTLPESTTYSKTTEDYNTVSDITSAIDKTTNGKSQTPSECSTVDKTDDALQSTRASKSSTKYTISLISKLNPIDCMIFQVTPMKNLIYILCCIPFVDPCTLRAYEDSTPHDLLMITIVEKEFSWPWVIRMVGFEKTSTFYFREGGKPWIYKLDIDRNKIYTWLSDAHFKFSLSVTSDDHILVLRHFENAVIYIFDEDANLVRTVNLPKDFGYPSNVIQKPNGEFIVSHRSREDDGICVSFLSVDGQKISQLWLTERVGFKEATIFHSGHDTFRIEMHSQNVYIQDSKTEQWTLTDLKVSNRSNDMSWKTVSLQSSDGRQFTVYRSSVQDVRLFYDKDNNNLFAVDDSCCNMYLLDPETLNWTQIGQLPVSTTRNLQYHRVRKQFTALDDNNFFIVVIFSLNKD